MGIEVLAPDVNESQVVFAPARNGQVIRFGLAAIKTVGEVAWKAFWRRASWAANLNHSWNYASGLISVR
jgi:DNA polymerase III alpha subunit